MPNKRYAIKEMFYTLQGKVLASRKSSRVLSAFGRTYGLGEKSRDTYSRFCDTDFVGIDGTHGGRYEVNEVVDTIFVSLERNRHSYGCIYRW